MENELFEILKREIAALEDMLSQHTAMWLKMKQEYESWCAERRAELGDSVADDELEWEKGSSVHEYYKLYVAPLEEQLAEKLKNKELFSDN